MRDLLETQFHCTILSWAEPTDDGHLFSAIIDGVMVQAESVALLVSALQDRTHQPIRLWSIAA